MRSPFHSETEAFHFVLLLLVALIPIVLAAALGPTWLAVLVIVVVAAALALRLVSLRMRKLRGLEIPVKMAPPHVGSASERRILVVANETLGEEALLSEVGRLAATPGTQLLLLAPAVVSAGARLTGAVDARSEQARRRLKGALERVGHESTVKGEVSEEDPLQAVDDAFSTFAPDEVIVSTRWEHAAGGLDPVLAGLVRERFAVPVRHLVFEPGAAAQEPDRAREARYRQLSAERASRRFGMKVLAGTALVAALLISLVALVQSNEREQERNSAQAALARAAARTPVAKVVDLTVSPESKLGPEGEKHDAFTITEFAVHVGQPQRLTITNTDDQPHSITSPGAGVNIVVMPGTHTYTLLVKHAGTFLWFCDFQCDEWAMQHPGYMSGYITAS